MWSHGEDIVPSLSSSSNPLSSMTSDLSEGPNSIHSGSGSVLRCWWGGGGGRRTYAQLTHYGCCLRVRICIASSRLCLARRHVCLSPSLVEARGRSHGECGCEGRRGEGAGSGGSCEGVRRRRKKKKKRLDGSISPCDLPSCSCWWEEEELGAGDQTCCCCCWPSPSRSSQSRNSSSED